MKKLKTAGFETVADASAFVRTVLTNIYRYWFDMPEEPQYELVKTEDGELQLRPSDIDQVSGKPSKECVLKCAHILRDFWAAAWKCGLDHHMIKEVYGGDLVSEINKIVEAKASR